MKVALLFLSLLPPFFLPLLPSDLYVVLKTISSRALVVVVVVVVCLSVYLSNILWLKPRRLRWKLQRQGINGPPPSFLYGNVPEMQRIQSANKSSSTPDLIAHDYTFTLFPYFEQWRKQYGQIYTYSTGNKQHLYVSHPKLVKEMNRCITFGLGKPSYITKRLAPLLGNGILRSNGHFWAQQRKIVAPEFFMDKVKGMVGLMVESAQPLVRKWEACIEAQGGSMAEIRVEEDLRSVSADVISRACFGSSYFKGKEIFSKLRTLQQAISIGSLLFGLPSFGFLATRQQKEIRGLEKEVESLIWETVKERERECLEASSLCEKDLLQMILEEAINDVYVGKESSKQFIVDNCKNIYFAGHESTATAASWCLMLLALHPEWQARIREETSEICQNGMLDSDSLPKMKTVTMVIQEVLRLYPPAAFVSREALEETQIGSITVPKGVCIWTLIPTLHRDPDIWGADANEFKPERFSNGVSNACEVPQAYVPFGLGPRLCLGKNFAMVQLKVVVSVIISNFTFSLSPSYQHSPAYRMIVEPGHGVSICIQRSKQEDQKNQNHERRYFLFGGQGKKLRKVRENGRFRWSSRWLFSLQIVKLSAKLSSQKRAVQQSPPPIFISTDPTRVNPLHLRDLYSFCNHSAHRFPNRDSDGRVEPLEVNKLRIAISHSSTVVSVFAKPDFDSNPPPEWEISNLTGIGGDWIQRLVPLSPANGRLVGFGRAVSDAALTASIYDVMVIPKLQGRGIGRMIVRRIIRMLTNRGIYDIAAICHGEERLFFKACGFGNDTLESTTMMYTRTGSNSQCGQMIQRAGRKLLLVPPLREAFQ